VFYPGGVRGCSIPDSVELLEEADLSVLPFEEKLTLLKKRMNGKDNIYKEYMKLSEKTWYSRGTKNKGDGKRV
jgi:hypothetical protein